MMLHIAGLTRQSLLRRVACSKAALKQCSTAVGRSFCSTKLASSGAARLLTTFAVVTAASSSMYAYHTADCQAAAVYASPPKTAMQPPAAHFLQTTKKRIEYYWLLLTRWLYLFFTFSPAMLHSPVLLFGDEAAVRSWWESFKQCILRSGPCCIKFAQWISTRPDLFPKEICQQFQHLQSNKAVPSWSSIEPVLRRNYGEHWASLLNLDFDEDSQTPRIIGGGCVAQVLKGRVKVFSDPHDVHSPPIEKEVAIKITHPGVRQSIVADIELMRTVSATLEYWLPSIEQVSLADSVEEFAKLMLEQVDMVFEARALETFRQHFSSLDSSTKFMNMIMHQSTGYDVVFPEPIFEYTTEDVLVESYADGVLIRDYIKVCSEKDKKLIAKVGLDAIFKMIFLDNFIHADLHPGNIIFCHPEEQQAIKLCFIDAGLVVSLQPSDRRNLIDLFKAVITKNGYEVGKLMVQRSRSAATIKDADGFAAAMEEIVNDVHQSGLTLGRIGVSALLQKVLILCYKHQVKLESRFASVIVAMGVVEGLGRQLDPHIDILQKAAPFVMRASLMTTK